MSRASYIPPQLQAAKVITIATETSYTRLLRKMGVKYHVEEPIILIGRSNKSGGWILHLSVVFQQVEKLFQTVIPYLVKEKAPCKIYLNEDLSHSLLDGSLGYAQLGKVLTVYPDSDEQARRLAEGLMERTKDFFGPAIPTDIHLGGVVYARYGSINPVLVTDASGMPQKYYTNKWGMQVKDEYLIPYKPLPYADWPFERWAKNEFTKPLKFLKRKYAVFVPLKQDAKGTVYQGVDVSHPWRGLEWCIIKEAKRYMAYDEHGRDMVDRLLWQKELHETLQGQVNVPRIVDYFSEGGSYYLVMKRITGQSFQEVIESTLNNHAWFSVEQRHRRQLLTHYLHILRQVQKLHELGYVHRDLTPANFLVKKDGTEWLIDLELSYHTGRNVPHPAFKLGSGGYMSPEQLATAVPTVCEDIYALGSMLSCVLTGFNPARLIKGGETEKVQKLVHFTHDASLCYLVAACTEDDPTKRPPLNVIIHVVEDSLERVDRESPEMPSVSKPADQLLKSITEGGLVGLADPAFLGPDGIWTTGLAQDTAAVGNARTDRMVLSGFGQGLSGILYVIAKGYEAGYPTGKLNSTWKKAQFFLETGAWAPENIAQNAPGLSGGAAGVAIGLCKGQASGFLARKLAYRESVQACLQRQQRDLDLAEGAAGVGLALLSQYNGEPWQEKRLKELVNQILGSQQKDGSWRFPDKKGKYQKVPWFANGVAGVVYFLGSYVQRIKAPDESVKAAWKHGLHWLRHKAKLEQPWLDKQMKGILPPKYSLRSGLAGLALTCIQAYQVTREEMYKDWATQLLLQIPCAFMKADQSTWTGMAGIGEVYLEAYRAFKSQQWQHRADWIAQCICQLARINAKGGVTWLVESGSQPDSNLFEGQAGIAHFLMRYREPEHITPLFF